MVEVSNMVRSQCSVPKGAKQGRQLPKEANANANAHRLTSRLNLATNRTLLSLSLRPLIPVLGIADRDADPWPCLSVRACTIPKCGIGMLRYSFLVRERLELSRESELGSVGERCVGGIGSGLERREREVDSMSGSEGTSASGAGLNVEPL